MWKDNDRLLWKVVLLRVHKNCPYEKWSIVKCELLRKFLLVPFFLSLSHTFFFFRYKIVLRLWRAVAMPIETWKTKKITEKLRNVAIGFILYSNNVEHCYTKCTNESTNAAASCTQHPSNVVSPNLYVKLVKRVFILSLRRWQ